MAASPLASSLSADTRAASRTGFGDARGVNALKLKAGQDPQSAVKEAAKQFESLFMQQLLKSMRESTQASGMLALSDDSGLCVDALNGDPGVYTADWAGVPRDFKRAMTRVENALQAANATSPNQRKASFNATLCLAHPDGRDVIYHGQCFGTLVWPPRGDQGHGYDPVFMPDGYDLTFGQMSPQMKHSWSPGQQGLSHRARSFAKFVENQVEQ